MTKSDLIHAYIRGDVDRRDFIRKLTAVGVSSGAAAVYATSLVGASAAPAGLNAAGFLAQGEADADYGIAIIIEDLLEAVQTIISVIQRILARLQALLQGSNNHSVVSLSTLQDDDSAEVIADIQGQMQDHLDALVALFPELTVESADAEEAGSDDPAALADDANLLSGIYAAILPNMEDPEQKQTVTEIAIVSGRHAAMLSHYAGTNPVPTAFEVAIDPATVG